MSATISMDLQMVDLRRQYLAIKDEIDAGIAEVLDTTQYINGPKVGKFTCDLAGYLNGTYALGCANGTDALQIALMALDVGPGDEVITTPFTFIATAEVAALLGAVPVFADIDPRTFNIDPSKIEELITPRTKAIVPVHLFGQPADLDPILAIAKKHNLPVIEDNAQAIGATYKGQHVGYIGDIGTLSFFPSKNLGCYGDGGGVLTNDDALFHRMKMIANHGAKRKYYHEVVGINSRLDAIQAAILSAKLAHLDEYTAARQAAADRYDELLGDVEGLTTPFRADYGTHVFHQYTIRIDAGHKDGRDGLAAHLKALDIPHAIYYPVPLHQLEVFKEGKLKGRFTDLHETEHAAAEVLSLPMHTELTADQQAYIADHIKAYMEG